MASLGNEVAKPAAASTWRANLDTNANKGKESNIRLRYLIQNRGSSSSINYRLQSAAKGANPTCEDVPSVNFSDVPASTSGCGSSPICITLSSSFSDGDSTSNHFTPAYPSNSYTSGKMIEDPSNQTSALSLSTDNYTELEYNLQFTANASVSNSYCVRATNSGTALNTYTKVAEITNTYLMYLSGLVRQSDETTAQTGASGTTVTIVAQGKTPVTTTVQADGSFSLDDIDVSSFDNPLLVYLDNNASYLGSLVTIPASTGTSITNLDILQNRLVIRSDRAATSITNTNLGNIDSVDSDDLFSISGGNLTVNSGYELHIQNSDTFAPGGNITTQGANGALHLDDNSTFSGGTTQDYSIAGNLTIDTGATFNAPSSEDNGTVIIQGNFSNSGIFTANTGKITLNGGSQTISGDSTFYDLEIIGTNTRTVTFTGNSITQVASGGSLRLEGANNNMLTLQSNDSNDWYLRVDPTANISVSFVDVSHSNAAGYQTIDASNGTNNNGNFNTNWNFGGSINQKIINSGTTIRGGTKIGN